MTIEFQPAPVLGSMTEGHMYIIIPYEGREWIHESAKPLGTEQKGEKRVFESIKIHDLFLNRDAEMILQLSQEIADITHHQPYAMDWIVLLSQDYG
jgi:hypothetical protein